jgi:anaerobic magnesium-protoporphyrin IX monomethyl ester cyclase
MNYRAVGVTPNWRWDSSPLAVDTLRPPVAPPLEWAYLAGELGSSRLGVVDAYAEDLSLTETAERIVAESPSIVVLATAPSLLYWRCPPLSLRAPALLITALRERDPATRVVLIGPHGTHSPRYAAETSGADLVWRGATEHEFARLISTDRLESSPCTYEVDGTVHTSVFVEPAASIGPADYGIYSRELYRPHMWLVTDEERQALGYLSSGALAEASRGCPWSCPYCSKGPVRDRYERRTIESIRREIECAVEVGFDYVFFIDETFNIPSDHLASVLDLIAETPLQFGFQGRPDLVTEAWAERMAAAGCVYSELGVDLVGVPEGAAAGRRQRLDHAERGLDVARQYFDVVRYNRLNATTLDYVDFFGDPDIDWAQPADPIYPYPETVVGRLLMSRYGYIDFDWRFAETYSWWLRIEVFLQRSAPLLPRGSVESLRDIFLTLPDSAAEQLAEALEGVQNAQQILNSNKSIGGIGGELQLRRPSA